MEAFITTLTTDVTITELWGAIAPAAAIVAVAVVVGFGYRVLRRSVGGLGRGKATI